MGYSTIILLVLLLGMMWFMQRTQRRQAQERQNQLNAVQKGDEIVTIGGLYGIIDEIDTDKKQMVLDVDGVYLTFELSALKTVITKASAVTEETAEAAEVSADDAADTQETMDSAIDQ
ncbi:MULTISPECIES: preprotein translocase subunit YajC [Streptococcus]|uniref:Preprotein translocase subunit YajC n=1 Tax=Streptococcus pantholopis TaxID=1811193 RepID=A0A172Q941_9STRE|nr:preprotein translocase subunit YajC [Streptococcus pantholopis]AND79961.1 preprotein translocase subunit YajC [Streptococcus pantholopis]